jgi:type II secretory pathway pseudopilin PulG
MMTSRRHRAYTLVELGVVVVLTTLLTLGMVRWLVGVAQSSQTGVENSADYVMESVFNELRRDILGVRHCDPSGGDARVVLLASDTLTLVSDPDGDGSTETVTWRYEDGTVQRGTAAMGENCATGLITEWTTWIANADSMSFSAVRDGIISLTGTSGVCQTEYEQRCAVGTIHVSIQAGEFDAAEERVLDI